MTCSTKTKKGAIASTTLSGMVIASLAFGAAGASAQPLPDNPDNDLGTLVLENLLDLSITLGFAGEEFVEGFPDLAVGDWVTVGSGGFEPNEEVVILLGSNVIGETVANEDGVVNYDAQIPALLSAGAYNLSIEALDSDNVASVELSVINTSLDVTDDEFAQGQDFDINGSGFWAGEPITVVLYNGGGEIVEGVGATTTADEEGNFTVVFSAPETLDDGEYSIRAFGDESNRSAGFRVIIEDGVVQIVDFEDDGGEDVADEFGFDGLRTGTLSTFEDGETVELEITATLDGEDVEDIEFDADDFTVLSDNEDDVVDGLSVTFNGEGERVLTVIHNESGVTAIRTVEVAVDADDEEDEEEGDEDTADEFGFDGLRIDSLGDFEDGGSIDLNIVATLDGEDVDDIEFDADDFTITSDNEDDVVDGFTVNLNGEGERLITIVHNDSGVTISVAADVPVTDDEDEDEGEEQGDITVTLSQSEVSPGDSLVLSAEGFEAGEEVVIELNPTLSTVNADEDGNVETVIVIPDDIELGDYEITATGESGAVGTAALSVVAAEDEDEDEEDDEVVVPPTVSWSSPFPSTVGDGYTATVPLLDAEGNDVSDLVSIVSSADTDEIDGNQITFNGFGERTVDVFLTDFPEVGFTTSVNVLEDEEFPVVDDEDSEESDDTDNNGGTDDEDSTEDGTDDENGSNGNGSDESGSGSDDEVAPGSLDESGAGSLTDDDGMIADEWDDFTPVDDSFVTDQGSSWNDAGATDRNISADTAVVADEAVVTDDSLFVQDDPAETAVIASGFVEENPGAAAGIAALLLSGIGAAAFGAHRLMRRTS